MANWAKWQEEAVGLPVVKRARHSIHFKRPDGKIESHFTCAPCHYDDGGVWKAIDTALKPLGDGYFGCPHSKVKVHPDGRVGLTGSDYTQRVELPSAQGGVVDGDVLVRTFSFGEQRMWVTEDGFRSEITLNRIPTLAEARKLVATESGTLPKEYLKGLTTATDANGDEHTFTTLAKFRTWLAGAVYPVVIDPDFAGDSSDGYITANPNADFSVPRSTSNSFTNNATTMNCGGYASYVSGAARYALFRTYIKFNTSSIPDTDIVTQVNLKLTHIRQYFSVTSPTSFDVVIMKQDWSSLDLTNATDRETAWDGCLGGTQDDNIWKNTNGLSANTQYASGNLDTDYINVDGYTTYSLISSFDLNNVQPVRADDIFGDTQNCFINIGNAGHATEAYRPVLTILHEAGASPDKLTSKDISSGVPTVDKSTIGQTHALTSTSVTTPAPTVDKATMGQKHALVSKDISTPAPTVDKPTLVEVPADTTDELVSKDISSGVPTVDKATLGQKHAIVSKNVATPAPVVDKAILGQKHALVAKDVATPAPIVSKPVIGQIHALVAVDITAGAPIVDKPTIGTPAMPVTETITGSMLRYEYFTPYGDDEEVLVMYAMLEL